MSSSPKLVLDVLDLVESIYMQGSVLIPGVTLVKLYKSFPISLQLLSIYSIDNFKKLIHKNFHLFLYIKLPNFCINPRNLFSFGCNGWYTTGL